MKRKLTNKTKERKARKLLRTGIKDTPNTLKHSCYVCHSPIKTFAVYIGQGLYRHEKCAVGSVKWLNSEIGLKSNVREYFEPYQDKIKKGAR